MTGTTMGTPLSESTMTLRLRSWLSRYTARPPSTTAVPRRRAIRTIGAVVSPRALRLLFARNRTPA